MQLTTIIEIYTANSKSMPARDRNQAGSIQLDAKHNHAVKFVTTLCIEFKCICPILTWQQQWVEIVQVLSEWNDTIELIPPTCTSVFKFIYTLSKSFMINLNYCSNDTGFILAQCITVVECEVYKIMFTTCASAVNKAQ